MSRRRMEMSKCVVKKAPDCALLLSFATRIVFEEFFIDIFANKKRQKKLLYKHIEGIILLILYMRLTLVFIHLFFKYMTRIHL